MVADVMLTVKQIARELGLANTRVMSLIRRGHTSSRQQDPLGPPLGGFRGDHWMTTWTDNGPNNTSPRSGTNGSGSMI